MNKFKKKVMTMALSVVIITATSTGVFAESVSTSGSYNNVYVGCNLAVKWSALKNDSATATTYFDESGISGCKAKTKLYYCYNAWSEYTLANTSIGKITAISKTSHKGVWKFKSRHFVVSASDTSKVLEDVTTLTDW